MTPVPDWPRARVVALESGRNFRDLGGYAGASGRSVRWGLLFRSGSMAALSEADREQLRARGIRAVCDLRTTHERESEPFPHAAFEGLAYWSRDYLTSFAALREAMQAQAFTTGEDARAGMIAGYRELPFEQAPAYRQLFAYLQAGAVPLVVNCTAGKDRAGTAAALVLRALGVARETVIEDYVLTDTVLDVRRHVLGRAGMAARHPPEVSIAIARADPAYLAAALDAIDARHGGIEPYLRDVLDVDAAALAGIRAALLEDAPER